MNAHNTGVAARSYIYSQTVDEPDLLVVYVLTTLYTMVLGTRIHVKTLHELEISKVLPCRVQIVARVLYRLCERRRHNHTAVSTAIDWHAMSMLCTCHADVTDMDNGATAQKKTKSRSQASELVTFPTMHEF